MLLRSDLTPLPASRASSVQRSSFCECLPQAADGVVPLLAMVGVVEGTEELAPAKGTSAKNAELADSALLALAEMCGVAQMRLEAQGAGRACLPALDCSPPPVCTSPLSHTEVDAPNQCPLEVALCDGIHADSSDNL